MVEKFVPDHLVISLDHNPWSRWKPSYHIHPLLPNRKEKFLEWQWSEHPTNPPWTRQFPPLGWIWPHLKADYTEFVASGFHQYWSNWAGQGSDDLQSLFAVNWPWHRLIAGQSPPPRSNWWAPSQFQCAPIRVVNNPRHRSPHWPERHPIAWSSAEIPADSRPNLFRLISWTNQLCNSRAFESRGWGLQNAATAVGIVEHALLWALLCAVPLPWPVDWWVFGRQSYWRVLGGPFEMRRRTLWEIPSALSKIRQ